MRELTRIPDKKQAARVAKRIIAEVEKDEGPKLSALTVRRFVDEDLGIKRPKPESRKRDDGIDLREYIGRQTGTVEGILAALKGVSDEAWELFNDDNPRMVKRLATACDSLAAFYGGSDDDR